MRTTLVMVAAILSSSVAQTSQAQIALPPGVTREDLAKNNELLLDVARNSLKWDERAEPSKIVGPLYYVGTAGLGSYLITTSEGHILLNTGMPGSGPMIVDSIRRLGFDPDDVEIMIAGHGHLDHVGAFAYLKDLTGADVAIMDADVSLLEDGGKSDFHYGHDWQIMGQPPVAVDRVLRDGDTVRLGEVVLTAHHTPGHTRGGTTWTTTLVDGGKAYQVVWPEGACCNPGYRLATESASYPGIDAD